MPILVRHTPVGALGRAALLAGQARAAQLQAGRDIQFTSMAMAAQERMTARREAAFERKESRTFALQRAAAAQIARQQALEPSARVRRFIPEKLPKTPARQAELTRQSQAFKDITQQNILPFQRQVRMIDLELGKRFTLETQQFLRENPRFADEETQKLLAQQQRLQGEISGIKQQAQSVQQQMRLGFTIPEQAALAGRQEEAEYKRTLQQIREAGKISEREKLDIDIMRDREQDQRVIINREITRLTKDLAPFEEETPSEIEERTKPIREQIQLLRFNRNASYAREKTQTEKILRAGSKKEPETLQVITDAAGRRWHPTNRFDAKGKRIYESD